MIIFPYVKEDEVFGGSVADLNAKIVSELSADKISDGSLPPLSKSTGDPLNRALMTSPQRDMSINSIETRVESPKSPPLPQSQRKMSQLTMRSQLLSPGLKKHMSMSPRPALFGPQIGSPTLSYSAHIQNKVDDLNE